MSDRGTTCYSILHVIFEILMLRAFRICGWFFWRPQIHKIRLGRTVLWLSIAPVGLMPFLWCSCSVVDYATELIDTKFRSALTHPCSLWLLMWSQDTVTVDPVLLLLVRCLKKDRRHICFGFQIWTIQSIIINIPWQVLALTPVRLITLNCAKWNSYYTVFKSDTCLHWIEKGFVFLVLQFYN